MVARPNENSRQKPEKLISETGLSLTSLFFENEYEFIRKLAYENHTNMSEMLRRIVRAAMNAEKKEE